MEEEPSESGITPSGRLIRWLVGGLPLGLIVMGALSFVIWNYKKQEKPPVVLEFAAMLQREVNQADFDRYVRLITEDIGGSSMSATEKADAVAGFVESSMGLDNMGYETRRKRTDEGGWVVYSELPAQGRARSVLLVVAEGGGAESDKGKAGGVAALMSVAHALTGKPQKQLVRFAVVSDDLSLLTLAHGVGRVIKVVQQPEENGWVFDAAEGDVVAKLKALQDAVESAAGQ